MKATAWNNGQHHPSGAGYGIKFTAADRDHFFRREWESIQLEVPGEGTTSVPLSASFWRRCSELRSATVGRWLRGSGLAPWPKGQPPKLNVEQVEGSLFRLRAG